MLHYARHFKLNWLCVVNVAEVYANNFDPLQWPGFKCHSTFKTGQTTKEFQVRLLNPKAVCLDFLKEYPPNLAHLSRAWGHPKSTIRSFRHGQTMPSAAVNGYKSV